MTENISLAVGSSVEVKHQGSQNKGQQRRFKQIDDQVLAVRQFGHQVTLHKNKCLLQSARNLEIDLRQLCGFGNSSLLIVAPPFAEELVPLSRAYFSLSGRIAVLIQHIEIGRAHV